MKNSKKTKSLGKKRNISKSSLDKSNPEDFEFKTEAGLNEEIVRQISTNKNEPNWMLEKRLEGLKIFNEKSLPRWGPDISDLNIQDIYLYLKPNAKKNSKKWEDVPSEIRNTFEKLGIPEAEKKAISGTGAQYESEMIYHKLKTDLEKKGVIFLEMDEAVKKYPEMIKKYFMTNCVSPLLHKFSALHSAVWSSGTFIYVPKGVKVDIPLQSYFRMNAKKGGQFEHTLIIADEGSEVHYFEGCSAPFYTENSLHVGCSEIHVLKNAKVEYSSIGNLSKNVYNLNTKRAIVHENGKMDWLSGNLGGKTTMLYPCSVLIGKNAKTNFLGISYSGKGQNQDTGCKVYHLSENTSSNIVSKSICKDGGIASYRGLVKIHKGCINSKSSVKCEGLMLDNKSVAKTFPSMDVEEKDIEVSHEASVGSINEEQLFYLMSRGLSKEEATKMIISGFIEPVISNLPLEYSIELNKFIELEIENSIV